MVRYGVPTITRSTNNASWMNSADCSALSRIDRDTRCKSRSSGLSICADVRLSGTALRAYFLTHTHHDHCPVVPRGQSASIEEPFAEANPRFAGLSLVPLPGHAEDLQGLTFRDEGGKSTWIVGDAVLDRD